MFARKLMLTALVAALGIVGGTSASAESVHYVFRMPIKGVVGPAIPASAVNPPNNAQYQWLDRSEACPPGEVGSNTWQEVFETTPVYRSTGQIRNLSNTCMPPLGIPVLSGPTSAYPGAVYNVSWSAVPTATRYELLLNDGNTEGTVYSGPNTTAPRVASMTVGQTDHLWARACDATRCGDWSSSIAIAVATPPAPNASTVSAPAIVIAGDSIDVSWTPSASPGGYPLWYTLKGHKDGETATTLYSGSAYSFSVLNANPAGTTYSFSLEACDTYNCSAATAASTLVNPPAPAAAPSLTAPASVYPSKNFTVSWTAVAGSTKYELIQNDNPTPAYSGTNTSAAFTAGTTVGTSYKFQIKACNVTGCSALSTASNVAVSQPPAPAAPASLAAPATVIAGGDVTVTWGASSNPGGYALHYELVTNKDGGAATQVYSGTATSATGVSGASPAGSTYGFGIRACDTYNCSSYAWASTLVQAPIPGTPTISATPSVYPGKTVAISWTAASGATSYNVNYWMNGSNGGIAYSGSATSITSGAASGTVGTVYAYAVQACNATGCSGWSSQATATVVNPPAPAAPATLNAPSTVIVGGSIPLSWSTSSSPQGYAFHYEVVYNTGSGNVSVYSGAATSTSISNANPSGATYANFVRACDTYNCSGWTQANTVVQAPIPAIPTLSGGGSVYPSKNFTISWAAVSGATSYNLYQSGSLVYSGAGTSKAFTAGGTVGSVYPYQVNACNATGCSGLSAQANVTVANPPAPAAPATLNAPSTVIVGGSIPLSWSTSSSPQGYAFHYEVVYNFGVAPNTSVYSGTGLSASVSNASPVGQTYRNFVRACDTYNCSGWTQANTVVNPAVPGTPSNLTVTPTVYPGGTVNISWGAASGATSYILRVRYPGVDTTLAYTGTATSGTASTTVGTIYTYNIQACNVSGCSAWSGNQTATVVANETTLNASVSAASISIGKTSGSITITASGGTGSYTYLPPTLVSGYASYNGDSLYATLSGNTYGFSVIAGSGAVGVNATYRIGVTSGTQTKTFDVTVYWTAGSGR